MGRSRPVTKPSVSQENGTSSSPRDESRILSQDAYGRYGVYELGHKSYHDEYAKVLEELWSRPRNIKLLKTLKRSTKKRKAYLPQTVDRRLDGCGSEHDTMKRLEDNKRLMPDENTQESTPESPEEATTSEGVSSAEIQG